MPAPWDFRVALDGSNRPDLVISYGMGVDSTAMLLRMIHEPHSWPVDWDHTAVLTSMVGDEWETTRDDVYEVMLPLFRRHRIRFVQAARHARTVENDGTGLTVFSDTRHPTTLHFDGAFRLSDELLAAGTVPQVSNRRCSIRSKGDVLDPIITALTAGRPYRHALGFEAGEETRALRDTRYNTTIRTGVYPLIEWGWTRKDCERYVLETTGRRFQRSACVFCPFALSSRAGRAQTLQRYAHHPAAGARALFIEHVSLCFNPRQALIPQRRRGVTESLLQEVRAAGLDHVLALFEKTLAEHRHGVYEVRRLRVGSKRSTRLLAKGSRSQMQRLLPSFGGSRHVDGHGITRQVLRGGDGHHMVEHFFVVAPAVVETKQRPNFETWWQQATAPALFTIA